MSLSVTYLDSVVCNDIPALPKSARMRVQSAIADWLTAAPQSLGTPLRYSCTGARILAVGDYRVIYRLDRNGIVILQIIQHSEVYV